MRKTKSRANRITLEADSCTINGRNVSVTIRAGDCVLMRPPYHRMPFWVAKVTKIESDNKRRGKVHIQWYYRPEDTVQGRRRFNGTKELLLSDHYDIQSVNTIEGKCTVHSFKNYTKLKVAGDEDFFCRFEYFSSTGKILPELVAVDCVCEMPRNPDLLIIQCEGCGDWFHPRCIDMTEEEAKLIEHFFCRSCLAEERRIMHPQRQNQRGFVGDAQVE